MVDKPKTRKPGPGRDPRNRAEQAARFVEDGQGVKLIRPGTITQAKIEKSTR